MCVCVWVYVCVRACVCLHGYNLYVGVHVCTFGHTYMYAYVRVCVTHYQMA